MTEEALKLLSEEEGQDLIEWALLASFIAIVAVVTLYLFGDPLLGIYQGVLDRLIFVNGYL